MGIVRTDSHVRPDLVLNIAPANVKPWLEVFNSCAAIVFCAAVNWYGWQVVATAWMIDERSASDLRFPRWIYYAALPAGGLLMLARYVITLAGLVGASAWRVMIPQHPGGHELSASMGRTP